VKETQVTVSDWADRAFGPATSNIRIAARANEEMAELLRALSIDDRSSKAPEEIADVVIILYRLARNLGADLHTEINLKMAVNRGREWKRDATGHGYHVRAKPDVPPAADA
jgi:NTP pyrophosphatase (non-canonical NTP hydrolase)